MRIAVDVMGGDYAPEEIVKGAISSLEKDSFEIVFLGKEENVNTILREYDFDKNRISIINCNSNIESGEFPLTALKKKKDCPIVVGAKLIEKKEVDAFISAGNSGAVMAAAISPRRKRTTKSLKLIMLSFPVLLLAGTSMAGLYEPAGKPFVKIVTDAKCNCQVVIPSQSTYLEEFASNLVV